MKISREFARILIGILKNENDYDKQTAIKQLESAIKSEEDWIKCHPCNGSISPGINSHVSMQSIKRISNKFTDKTDE